MIAVFKREFQSYFHSMIGYLVIAFMLIMAGIYFMYYNLTYGYPEIAYMLSGSSFIFLLVIPILTMKVFAEEKKQKTDQLLLTSPVTITQVVMGKYLAMVAIFAIPVAVICLYPLLLSTFGTVALGGEYVAILGYFLYGAAGIAIGLFISSLTESQVIAAVLTCAVLIISNLMSAIQSMMPFGSSVLDYFALQDQMSNFLNKMLDLGAVVYYLSVVFLFIFLTVQSVQKRRWS